MTTQDVIHVAGLTKSYDKVEALRGVDFDVARGSIFALTRTRTAQARPRS